MEGFRSDLLGTRRSSDPEFQEEEGRGGWVPFHDRRVADPKKVLRDDPYTVTGVGLRVSL